jgi:hypothetical protein
MLPGPFIGAAIEKELSSLSCVDKEISFCFTDYVMVLCELRKFVRYLSRDREVAVNDKLRKICKKLSNKIIKEGLICRCPLVSSVIIACKTSLGYNTDTIYEGHFINNTHYFFTNTYILFYEVSLYNPSM